MLLMGAGPITGLLSLALDEALIDCALVTDKNENFRPFPYLAENKKDLAKSVGYKPSQSPTLSLIGKAINKERVNIAVVGTPCQIQALRKMQNHPAFDFEAYDLISLAISTFCFGTFHNLQLNEIIKGNGIVPKDISKIKTNKNNFKLGVTSKTGTKEFPLNLLYDKAIRNACFQCSDYAGAFADISIGHIGSEEGWNTLVIRTQRAKELVDLALKKGVLETCALDKNNKELVLEISRNKTDIVEIEAIQELSPDIKSFVIRNERIAKAYRPGMFVILWLPDVDFLPMSVSKVDGSVMEITVQKIGEGTKKLFELKVGDKIGVRGPYGNAWNYEDASNILIVGGGMGIAALTTLIEPLKKNKKNVFVAIGAKDEASLIFADSLIDMIPNTACTTDDGSVGKKCFVTEAMEDILNKNKIDLIITCGPEVLMKRVLEIAESKKILVQASLERKMKCGVGLCGSCCVGSNNDICACKDGPIFKSEQLKKIPQFGTYKK